MFRREPCQVVQESAKTSPESAAGLYVIPTCQRSDIDLVRTGEVVENEKDRLLERVRVFMAMLRCHALGDWRMQTNGVLHAPQQVFASAASLITSPRRFSVVPVAAVLRICKGGMRRAHSKGLLGGLHRPLLWLAGAQPTKYI